MDWKSGVAALVMITAIVVALSGVLGSAWSVGVVIGGLVIGWLLVPDFWSSLAWGAIGGVVAGLMILGPGFRLAMRVVSVLDPVRTPEFTVEGTIFIVVGLGGIFGGIVGALSNVFRKGFGLKWPLTAAIPGLMVMLVLFGDRGLRAELLELGAGPWVNIPMFAAFAGGYGVVAMRLSARMSATWDRRKAIPEAVEVPA
jgi:hypothetical protein